MASVAILVQSLDVRFGTFQAISQLAVAIDYGEVRAIIGPNGAGKTTLLDVISGITRPQSGQVFFDETVDLTQRSRSEIARAGVRRKFQKPSVFDALTVRENIDAGVEPGFWSQRPKSEIKARVDEVLEMVGLKDDAGRLAGELAHGQKQWLEIGMVLGSNPKVLMLDEPVAGLTDEETERTAKLVRSLRSPQRAIIVVEHDMDFVDRIADRVTVLHEGRTLFEGSMANARTDERVMEVYLGR
ncbi:MAG: urea ABC transporter ATP-binding protein UrtD [Xanthobacteraceae bacterium]|nr:urea ABC transporter ATP-binding protein UrtD [Xanthobacteraceae bacterium]